MSHVFTGKMPEILACHPQISVVKNTNIFSMRLGLVTGIGEDDCGPHLILKYLNMLARSTRFVKSGKITTEDLC